MKKNTLLYLEKNLVQKAKNKNINLSEIAEKALKEALNESREINDPEYIFENAEKVLLSYTIHKIQLKNYAMFKNKTYTFKKTNLIIGPNASGKTLLLKALQGKKKNDPKDEVLIEISSIKKKDLNKDFTECILLDNSFSRLSREQRKIFLKWLKNKSLQIIATSTDEIEGFDNYIKLKAYIKKE